MIEISREKEKSPFLGKMNTILFIRAADYYDVLEKVIPSSKNPTQFRTPFSMEQFCSIITERLKEFDIDFSRSCSFMDTSNLAARETLRACMYKIGFNGQTPKSIPKYSASPDGPPFNSLLVDELLNKVYIGKTTTICIFVHDADTHHRLMYSFDRPAAIQMWDEGFRQIKNPGDILGIKYHKNFVSFNQKTFK